MLATHLLTAAHGWLFITKGVISSSGTTASQLISLRANALLPSAVISHSTCQSGMEKRDTLLLNHCWWPLSMGGERLSEIDRLPRSDF